MTKKNSLVRILVDSGSDNVLVEPESGRMFYLNETGAFVYRLLEKNTPDEEIIRLLCKEFDTQEAEAAADLGFFRKTLQAFLGRAS